MRGSRRTAARVTPGAISLSSSSHFPLDAVFEQRKSGGVAARPRQAFDEAGADRIGVSANTIGTVRVACCNAATAGAAGQDDVRRERDQFRRVSAKAVGIAGGPAVVDPHVAAVGPAQLLQPLQERPKTGLSLPDRPRPVMSTPMRRTRSACCARAASGHAAAPPSSVMNSRRRMIYLIRRGPHLL